MTTQIAINWGFWLHDELNFWYIPATMMLYLFAPAYMELIRRHPIYRWLPVVMIMWCILVQYVTPIHQAVGHLEIFWSRVPIFFIGINMGEMVRQKQTLDGTSIWMIWLMFLMTLLASIFLEQEKHGMFPLFLERMLYIPLTITSILLLNRIFGHYGVPVFLFLSAYGLVMKYEAKPHLSTEQQTRMYSISGKKLTGSINWREPLHFIRYHYLKLFKMMIAGFVAFTMVDYITQGPHHYQTLDIISMLGMFNNVLDGFLKS
jgi:peptidoglycan/LPS O-acetylase OafA/YrhL